ncbi:MAG TPA: hypothetical protein PLB52_01910 [Candidatus Moranbacteria bacterium]|nr:hypothetical protein [Candidatus Moranbacteria bacterium]
MRTLAEVLQLREIKIDRISENTQSLLFAMAAFLLPFTMGHPQIVVGVVVNALLFLAAFNLKKYKILPVVLLPSLAVLSRGLIFGPFTYFLIYTIPFIWMGNLFLVASLKYLYFAKKLNKYFSLVASIAIKVSVLYFPTILLIKSGILPQAFAVSMGAFQVYTALAGCILALILQKAIKSKD